jgi:predicted kinase
MKAYVLVGAPGAGKSTLASKIAQSENAVVISGDDVRAELYGDEANQGQWTEIQDRIEEILSESVGCPVIMDGTHYLSSYRREALALLRSYGYNDIEAIVVNPPLETCIQRNANRHRSVARHVVIGMYEKLQKSLSFISIEGFTKVSRYGIN